MAAGVLLIWNFKPSKLEVVEKFIDNHIIVEVMPPLNCIEVKTIDTIKKGESLSKLITPYSELKAAYVDCMASISEYSQP
jgi:hypothetical protein